MNIPLILESNPDYFVNTKLHAHPPLGEIIFYFHSYIFGTSLVFIRLLPILFSIFNIFFLYYITKKFYGEKVAFFSLLLSSISFHWLVTSAIVSIDQFAVTIFLLFLYLILNKENIKERFSIYMGILLGISILLKYQFIILYLILFIYLLITSYRLKYTLISFFKSCIVSLILFSFYPVFSYFTDFNLFLDTLRFIMDYASTVNGVNLPFGTIFTILALYSTPLLIGLAFLRLISFMKLKKQKQNFRQKEVVGQDIIHIIIIIINLLFFLFVVKRGDYSRYLMIILPSLTILSSQYLSKIKFNKALLFLTSFFALIVFSFSHVFSYIKLSEDIFVLQNVNFYMQSIKNLNFNFFFPFHIDHGHWVGANFLLIFLIYLFSLVIFISLFLIKNKKLQLLVIVLFIGFGFGYNSYLSSEHLFHLSQPDPNPVINEMIDFFNDNNLDRPIYVTDKAFLYKLNTFDIPHGKNEKLIIRDESFRIDDIDFLKKKISQNGGTIIFLNFGPHVEKDKIISLENCNLIKRFSSKEIEMGYILTCESD